MSSWEIAKGMLIRDAVGAVVAIVFTLVLLAGAAVFHRWLLPKKKA